MVLVLVLVLVVMMMMFVALFFLSSQDTCEKRGIEKHQGRHVGQLT
jgi:hypothetical protein